MRTIYLDHAATSFPKPPAVGKRMQEYVETVGATVNRSSYGAAQEAGMVALRLRQRLGALFSFPDPAHVVLTPGNTWGLSLSGFRDGAQRGHASATADVAARRAV